RYCDVATTDAAAACAPRPETFGARHFDAWRSRRRVGPKANTGRDTAVRSKPIGNGDETGAARSMKMGAARSPCPQPAAQGAAGSKNMQQYATISAPSRRSRPTKTQSLDERGHVIAPAPWASPVVVEQTERGLPQCSGRAGVDPAPHHGAGSRLFLHDPGEPRDEARSVRAFRKVKHQDAISARGTLGRTFPNGDFAAAVRTSAVSMCDACMVPADRNSAHEKRAAQGGARFGF